MPAPVIHLAMPLLLAGQRETGIDSLPQSFRSRYRPMADFDGNSTTPSFALLRQFTRSFACCDAVRDPGDPGRDDAALRRICQRHVFAFAGVVIARQLWR